LLLTRFNSFLQEEYSSSAGLSVAVQRQQNSSSRCRSSSSKLLVKAAEQVCFVEFLKYFVASVAVDVEVVKENLQESDEITAAEHDQ
jgi:hypothetical protein